MYLYAKICNHAKTTPHYFHCTFGSLAGSYDRQCTYLKLQWHEKPNRCRFSYFVNEPLVFSCLSCIVSYLPKWFILLWIFWSFSHDNHSSFWYFSLPNTLFKIRAQVTFGEIFFCNVMHALRLRCKGGFCWRGWFIKVHIFGTPFKTF